LLVAPSLKFHRRLEIVPLDWLVKRTVSGDVPLV
jgi:hypothetical protein